MPKEKDVKLARKGNKQAFVRIIQACEMTMFSVAKAILRSDEAVADVLQEAILKAYSSIETLRETKYFKTWLIRIVINECKRELRNKANVVPVGAWIESTSDTPQYSAIEIEEALEALKEEHRIAVSLYYLEDMSIKDIAGLLEVPEGTVKSRLYTARKQLRELLNIHGEGGMTYDLNK